MIQRVESVQAGHVGTRTRIGYRLRVANADGSFIGAQQAFCDLTDGKITWLRMLCSGFVPVAASRDAQLEGRQS